jgi:hypothetical protein
MTLKENLDADLLRLIEEFESKKHDLQLLPAESQPNLVFGDVALLNKIEKNPYEGNFIGKRGVRTDMPRVFVWLFKKFTPILSKLPNYGMHKEEVFARLGNTLEMAESPELHLNANEKVAAVIQDMYEIAQDLIDGRVSSFHVAIGTEVVDDYISRSIKTGYVDHDDFVSAVFGEEK